MATGASLPDGGAQRRDQHPARQHQLDAGARGAAALERVRRRPAQAPARHPPWRQRHGHLRQRARVPGHVGPLAAPCRADDDSGAVERQPGHGSGGARLLRIPLVADGAVGRPGLDCLHRRHRHRRRARPQRPAPVALHRHHRRPGDHGLGSRRARHPRRARGHQGPAAARQDAARGHGPGAHRQRRRAEARPGGGAALRRLAARAPGGHRAAPQGARRTARSPDRAQAAAGVRLHPGRPAPAADADGHERRGADRLDGHRHGAGRAVRASAPALRLLRAALRPGHQSAARRHPRRDRHLDGLHHRAREQPARGRSEGVPADQDRVPHPPQRSGGQAAPPAAWLALPVDDPAAALQPGRGRTGPRAGHGGALPQGQSGGGRRLRHPHPFGSRRRCHPRADSEPAGNGRRAPPPGARGLAHQVRSARRERRCPRSAPRGAAHGLRRRRRQSLPGLRVAPRSHPSGPAARGHRGPGSHRLPQGPQQGRAEGDVQDGHLDLAELLRRADLRGRRPRPRLRREVLHVHLVADRRRGPEDHLGGSAPAPRAGLRPPPGRAGRTRQRRRIPVAPRRRSAPLQSRHRVPPAARDAHRQVQHLQGIHAARRRPEPEARHAARPVHDEGRGPARAAGRGRAE